MNNPFKGLNSYSIGNRTLGIQLVLRNLNITDKNKFPRRYVRFMIKILGSVITFEFRFSNSI